MKLIDILVEETIENSWSWPENANCITQDHDREIMPATCQPCVAKFEVSFNRWFLNCSRIDCFIADVLASDYETAIITREQYEAALAAKNEGWIEWRGGSLPVDDVTEVDIKFSAGGIVYGVEAGKYYWPRTGQEYDIIAYRLHNPQEAEQANADEEADLNECIGQDAAPVWNGEGLPPVGCECEFEADDGSWGIGTVLCVGKNRIFWLCHEDGDEYTSEVNLREFRPLRTEAGRKREEAIEEMIKIATMYTTKSLGLDLAFNSIYNSIAAGEIPGVKLED